MRVCYKRLGKIVQCSDTAICNKIFSHLYRSLVWHFRCRVSVSPKRSLVNVHDSAAHVRLHMLISRVLRFFLRLFDPCTSSYATFGLLDCAHYNEEFVIPRFVISRFCSLHFTVTLAGLKNIVRYTDDFVI